MQYNVIALIQTSKLLGTVEAENREGAEKKGELLDCSVNLCWQCSEQLGDVEITEVLVERV